MANFKLLVHTEMSGAEPKIDGAIHDEVTDGIRETEIVFAAADSREAKLTADKLVENAEINCEDFFGAMLFDDFDNELCTIH